MENNIVEIAKKQDTESMNLLIKNGLQIKNMLLAEILDIICQVNDNINLEFIKLLVNNDIDIKTDFDSDNFGITIERDIGDEPIDYIFDESDSSSFKAVYADDAQPERWVWRTLPTSVLFYAFKFYNKELIKFLSEKGADVNYPVSLSFNDRHHSESYMSNPLAEAYYHGDIDVMEVLIKNGAIIHPDHFHLKVYDSLEAIKLLIKSRAFINAWNFDDYNCVDEMDILYEFESDYDLIKDKITTQDIVEKIKLFITFGLYKNIEKSFFDIIDFKYFTHNQILELFNFHIQNGLNLKKIGNELLFHIVERKWNGDCSYAQLKSLGIRQLTKVHCILMGIGDYRWDYNSIPTKEITLTQLETYIINKIIELGIDVNKKNSLRVTALDIAKVKEKEHIINILNGYMQNSIKTSNILQKFSSDERLKYSNHMWDSSLDYNDFIKDLREGFSEIEDDLKILSSDLYQNIDSFLFDENVIGWSSKIIKEEIKKGVLPHNIFLDKGGRYHQPFKTFGDAIENFKSLFVVKQNDKKLKLLKKFTKIKKELGLKSIDLNDLKKDKIDKFFTDTKRFEKALTLILKDIQENSNDDKKDIMIEADTIFENGKDVVEIKIIHIDSTSLKTAEALKETIDKNGGNFQTIYSNLLSVCDWSIDTICQDKKRYRIDYLYPEINNTKPHCTQIDDESRGFTHILRFYI